jgi:hypothetical protein
MVDVKENVADRCGGGRGEGDGERPFLHGMQLYISIF